MPDLRPTLIIGCLSQKGGVGKSTLARLIAYNYAQAGWRVKIADFNVKQKTSVDWAAMRMTNQVRPAIQAEAFMQVPLALKQDVDLLVMDGKPDADPTMLEVAKRCDLIALACGTSADDLRPQVLFGLELVQRGVNRNQILYVLNQTTGSKVAIRDAQGYIRGAGFQVLEHDIPARTMYQEAQNSGRSLAETNVDSLNRLANAVAADIVAHVNKILEAA